MVTSPQRYSQHVGEETANAVSHGVGAGVALLLLTAMMWTASSRADNLGLVAAAAHGGSLVALLGTSALYHWLKPGPWKAALQTADHALIFALIAGSYTPYGLIILGGTFGPGLVVAQWVFAAFGVAFKLALGPLRLPWLSISLYLIMGWMGILAFGPLVDAMPWQGLALLVAGGLLYTGGVVFFVWETLWFNHFWWHLFVLGGAGCHAVATLGYVLPG